MLHRLRSKNLDKWLGGYARHLLARRLDRARPCGTRHLLFAFCDHFEPLNGGVTSAIGAQRVRAWQEAYPALARTYRDADGRHPRHTFFFPLEQYDPAHLDALGDLARAALCEVEVHLHHDGDTATALRATLCEGVTRFASHGHLPRDDSGRARYAFIHGNWCLANARADGRWCGVDEELPLLFETGCYADLTFPSAPDESQPNIVNAIYWPTGDLSRRRAYESGRSARVGAVRDDRILMIQGPLALTRRPFGRAIRIENGVLTARDPATPGRVRHWAAQEIHVRGRPEWVFVKVSTHGAPEGEAASLLGEGGHALHRALAEGCNDGARWMLHYVTAREMYNVAIAAMDGRTGDPADYFDYRLPLPPVAA